jgi:hypothetical protein
MCGSRGGRELQNVTHAENYDKSVREVTWREGGHSIHGNSKREARQKPQESKSTVLSWQLYL